MINQTKNIEVQNGRLPSSINENELDAEVVTLYCKQLVGILGGSVVLCVLTHFLFISASENNLIYIWSASILCFLFLRLLHIKKLPDKSKLIGNTQHWKNELTIFAGISGLAWGSLVLLVPNNDLYHFYIVLLLLGMSSTSITSLSLIHSTYIAYIIMSISPLTMSLFYRGGHIYNVLTIFTIVFIVASLFFSKNIHRSQMKSLRLRFENLDLVKRLNLEKNKAEQANREKSLFLAAASHDLRQPLHALGLFLDSMQIHLTNDESRVLLDKSNRSLHSLQDLFDTLLDISRLDAGVVEINQCDFSLKKIFSELRSEFQPQATLKQINFSISGDEYVVHSDPILLARCLRNLINNAIQHSQSSEISISCRSDSETLSIEVHDNGTGISEENLNIIFNEFQQLNNPERDRQKGLGLGLTIVKRLCDLLECDLYVESTLNKGTCFRIKTLLGNKTKENQDANQQTELPHKHQEASILVIDDEVEILDAIKDLISQWGHNVETTTSITSAMAILDAGFIPDLIISDYRLRAHRTGIEAIDQIHKKLNRKTPALIVTGDTSPERLREASTSGYPVIHKPVRPAMLRAALNQQLKKIE